MPEKEDEVQSTKQKERQFAPIKAEALEESMSALEGYGGFDIVSTTLDGVENMDPSQKALKNIFLTEEESRASREQLKTRLQSWIDLLESAQNVGEMIEKSQEKSEQATALLNQNLKIAVDACRKLEENYRTVVTFYRNAAGEKGVKNVSILNAPLDKLNDLDNPTFINAISEEINEKYDRLDLSNNYSLLVVPGWLGSKAVIDKWARMAHDNKVMLITDFRNLENPSQVMRLFQNGKFTGEEAFRANVMMTCNWLIGREKYGHLGEDDPLFIPPSASLAGRIHSNNIAQVTAGKKHGVLHEILGCRFDIRDNDLSDLADMGIVPTVFEFGQVQAFSDRTLFNGNNIGLQKYSVVRTFDWLTKSMMDYLNRLVFTNISTNLLMDINKEVATFFDKCKRESKVIENFGRIKVEKDPNHADRVHVTLHIQPFFPAKNFVIRLDGKRGDYESELSE